MKPMLRPIGLMPSQHKDFFDNGRGRATLYYQDLGAGYSAPGLATARDLTQYGGTAQFPFTGSFGARLKLDSQIQRDGLDTDTGELDLDYRMGEHWTLSSGVRHDRRQDNWPIVPATQEEGDRTDALVQLLFNFPQTLDDLWVRPGDDSRERRWPRKTTVLAPAAAIVLMTGSTWSVRFQVEISGPEAESGPSSIPTGPSFTATTASRTNGPITVYVQKGNLVSGFRTRYADSASIFLEERYAHGDVPTGLTHATGIDLAPTDRLNYRDDLS